MKKSLLILFGALLIFQGGLSYADTTETTGFFSALKNAIIKDVESTVQSTVSAAATRAMNQAKLAQYKQELAQKKQELSDLEKAKKNFIVKFFQRRRINREIYDLEEKIRILEGQ